MFDVLRHYRLYLVLFVLVLLASLLGMSSGMVPGYFASLLDTVALVPGPTPAPTFTLIPSPTDAPTATATATARPTDTPTLSPTLSPTLPPTATRTASPTHTLTVAPISSTVSVPAARLARVPILMYHYISVPPPDADALRIDLSVPPDIFTAEMKYLAEQGYQTVHLTDLANNLRTGAPLPPKPIVLTFDDGYEDNYLNAYPILKSFGFVGTFFIITNRPESSAGGYMTWAQINEMAANGMQIGSHSVDHRFDLGKMSPSVQWAEIKPAQDVLALRAPQVAPVFAYPSGSYNATTVSLLSQLGYVAAVTTRQGMLDSSAQPFELPRIRIRGPWSVETFAFWLNYWLKSY